jgi:5-methylcytosine-specific restriction endonuclease McrA
MVDHIVPVEEGGTNALSDLQTACRSCNGWEDHPARREDGADPGMRVTARTSTP